jgi:vacuole morphology and inheritance protein 14
MKDIVAEAAPNYVSVYPGNTNLSAPPSKEPNALSMDVENKDDEETIEDDKRAFSLARFIPLLAERVYVISPYTRMHLVSWLMVLDSVPDLELVAWLPEFLDGLL